jgi:hypothetical protein
VRASSTKPDVKTQSVQRAEDAVVLLKLISQSEDDFRRGRWKSQKAVEASLRREFVKRLPV